MNKIDTYKKRCDFIAFFYAFSDKMYITTELLVTNRIVKQQDLCRYILHLLFLVA